MSGGSSLDTSTRSQHMARMQTCIPTGNKCSGLFPNHLRTVSALLKSLCKVLPEMVGDFCLENAAHELPFIQVDATTLHCKSLFSVNGCGTVLSAGMIVQTCL